MIKTCMNQMENGCIQNRILPYYIVGEKRSMSKFTELYGEEATVHHLYYPMRPQERFYE